MGKYFKFRQSSFHVLVPDHEIATEREVEELLKKYRVQRWQLPRINMYDAAIADLDVVLGDVIKISRKSPTSGIFLTYRYVVDPSLGKDAKGLFDPISLECLSEEEAIEQKDEQKIAREIIGALKQATPPARGLDRITVGRDESMRQFTNFFDKATVEGSCKARFVIAEIGQGKSHFLFLLKDEAFRHNLAVSLIEVSLMDLERVYNRVLENFCFSDDPIDLGNLALLFRKLFVRIRKLAEKEIKDAEFDPLNHTRLALVMRKIVEKL